MRKEGNVGDKGVAVNGKPRGGRERKKEGKRARESEKRMKSRAAIPNAVASNYMEGNAMKKHDFGDTVGNPAISLMAHGILSII